MGELQRTADAMKRTSDIAGFADIVDGAVEIDPQAAARDIAALRELIAGAGLEDQLDGMLHDAMLKHVAPGAPRADQGDLLPAPAGEASTLEGGAGEDPVVDHVQATPPPSPAAYQGLEDDPRSAHGRVTDPVGLSEAKERIGQALPEYPPPPPPPAMQSPTELDRVSVRDPHSDARYIKDGDGALVRDLDGAPIEIDPQPGDPALTQADLETMSQRLDMLDDLTAQKDMTPAAFDRRVEILRETVGEDSALGLAFEAVAEQGRAKPRGEDDPSHDLAVAKAHALARDPSVHAAMRENREAMDRLTAQERAAAKAKRYGVESGMRDLMEAARDLSSDDPDYDKQIAGLEARYEALLARDASIPGLPHPDVDPGLAHDLGHTAGGLLEARAAVHDIMISAGLAVTPWGAGRAAARVPSQGAARAVGGAVGLGVMGVEMKRAAGDAIGAAARAEFEARGLDPKNPASFAKLPPEVRRKIAAKGAVAALANGGSSVAARQIATTVLGPRQSDFVGALIEEGFSTLIEESSQIIEE